MPTYPTTPNGSSAGAITSNGAYPLDTNVPQGPYDELGRPGQLKLVYSSRGQRQWAPIWSDPNEVLRFPDSVKVYDVMLRTDDQVDSVMRAVTLPILDAPWDLDGNGAQPAIVAFIRNEIGLTTPGEAMQHRHRDQSGIVFTDHMREALQCLAYGFAPFEQVYAPTFPGDLGHPDDELFANIPAIHLRKLGSRPPSTIRRIILDQVGDLTSIIQFPPVGEPIWFNIPDGEMGIEIPEDRLVVYVNDKKGADWSGISILRTAYRPWKIKEQLCRLEAMAAERNSMGMPVVHFDPTVMNEDAALELAQRYRSGADAGIAMPPGASIEILGVSGQVPDLGPKIERYNQAIGRASLAMFLNLGHDNGARSLGDTFLSFFTRSLQGIAGQMAQTFTEHVIRDLVEANFGPDEPYPRLVSGEITADAALTPAMYQQLTASGILIPDDPLEENVRRRFRLPMADTTSQRIPAVDFAELVKANILTPDDPLETQIRKIWGLPKADEDTQRIPADPKSKMPFQPEGDPNPLDPVVPAPGQVPIAGPPPANPFLPADMPGDAAPPPVVPPVAAADDEPAEQEPEEEPVDPDAPRQVVVPEHRRKWPAHKHSAPSLAGYAAWLASQVSDDED